MKTKIGILGSCVSRDAFNSHFVPNYKKFFEVVISAQRLSLISIMQDPINIPDDLIKISPDTKKNRARTWFIKYDLKKCLIKELLKKDIDCLIIDNYLEIRMGILFFNENILTNNNWDLPKTQFYETLNDVLIFTIEKYPNEYFEIWKKYCDLFFKFLEEECPHVKVILNKGRAIDKIIREDGSVYTNPSFTNRAQLINYFLDKLDSYIQDNFNVDIIEFDFENTFLDENHIWGIGPVHYSKEYYPRLINNILKIINNNNNITNPKINNASYIEETTKLNFETKLFLNNVKIRTLNEEIIKINRKINYLKNDLNIIQKNTNLQIINKASPHYNLISKFGRARIDLKNFGTIFNSLEIIENNDILSKEYSPLWFNSIEGKGVIIESEKGFIDLKIRCKNDGLLKIWLRGPDIKDKNGKQFPVYIDFTKFKINDKQYLDSPKLIYHNTPLLFEKEVSNSEIINLHIEWNPFNSSSVYEGKI